MARFMNLADSRRSMSAGGRLSHAKPIQCVRGRPALLTAWHRWGMVSVYVRGRLIATCRYPSAPESRPNKADS